jgi:hypothetical protein
MKMVRGYFTKEEDVKLLDAVNKYGTNNWKNVAYEMQDRNPKQCRERYNRFLKPGISKDPWTPEEDSLLLGLVENYGGQRKRWKKIAEDFKRSVMDLKKRYNLLVSNRCTSNASLLTVQVFPPQLFQPNQLTKRVPLFQTALAQTNQVNEPPEGKVYKTFEDVFRSQSGDEQYESTAYKMFDDSAKF